MSRAVQKTIELKSRDSEVLRALELLVAAQPHVRVSGLFEKEGIYFIAVESLGPPLLAVDGSPLLRWFFSQVSVSLPQIELVERAPDRVREVPRVGRAAAIEGRGFFRSIPELRDDLSLALGSAFPDFVLVNGQSAVSLIFERRLTDAELYKLEEAIEALEVALRFEVVIDPQDGRIGSPATSFKLGLLPAKGLGRNAPRKLRWLLEEDEEFWLTQRTRLLRTSEVKTAADVLPTTWRKLGLACVIDSLPLEQGNLRTYLTLYDTVVLTMPLASKEAETVPILGVGQDEITQLAQLGRVKLLLPQPIDRYDQRWLASLADAAPEALLLSRRLAAAVVADVRRRFPFIYAPVEPEPLRDFIALARKASTSDDLPPDARAWFEIILRELGELAYYSPLLLNRNGAMRTSRLGPGWLLVRYFERVRGLERAIEIDATASLTERASAIGAHVVPYSGPGFEQEPYADLVASFFSGVDGRGIPVAQARTRQVVDSVLGIDDAIPVVDFAKHFHGADVARFRAVANQLAQQYVDEETLADALKKFNDQVKQVEPRADRLRTFNFIVPLAGLATSAFLQSQPEHAEPWTRFAPVGVGTALSVTLALMAEATPKGRVSGAFWDFLTSILSLKPPDAVLVSRLRRQMKALR